MTQICKPIQAESDQQFDQGKDTDQELDLLKAKRSNALCQDLDTVQPRSPGLLPGHLSDAFFEPLPEEELQSWE